MNTLYYAYIIHASVFRITKNAFHVKEMRMKPVLIKYYTQLVSVSSFLSTWGNKNISLNQGLFI